MKELFYKFSLFRTEKGGLPIALYLVFVCHAKLITNFYSRDAMIARVLAVALCLSVTIRYFIETGRTDGADVVHAWRLLHCYKAILVSPEIRILPSRILF